MNFTLGDNAFFVRVIVLDGILDCDDVGLPVLVDPVHHGRKGRGLARSGRTGDQDEASGTGQQCLDGRGQTNLIHRQKATGDEPKNEAVVFLGFQDADAEAGVLSKRNSEIRSSLSFQAFIHVRGQNRSGDLLSVFGSQDGAFVRSHLSRDSEHGSLADLKVEVGSTPIHDGGEELAEIGGGGRHREEFRLYMIT